MLNREAGYLAALRDRAEGLPLFAVTADQTEIGRVQAGFAALNFLSDVDVELRRVQQESGRHGPSAASSITKSLGAQHNKDKHELMVEILGLAGVGWECEPFTSEELEVCRQWLRSKGNSIEGGTSEIQTNIVAKQVLGLPG